MFGYNIIQGELYDICTKEIVEASRKQPINSLEFRIKLQIFECIQRMKFSDTLLEKMLNKARSGKLIEIIYNDYMKKGKNKCSVPAFMDEKIKIKIKI